MHLRKKFVNFFRIIFKKVVLAKEETKSLLLKNKLFDLFKLKFCKKSVFIDIELSKLTKFKLFKFKFKTLVEVVEES